jgi:hypothetical protein
MPQLDPPVQGPPRRGPFALVGWLALTCALASLAIAIAVAVNQTWPHHITEPPAYPEKPQTPAAKLATIDYQEVVGDDDPRAEPYRDCLRGLARRCANSEQEIADMTVKAQELLAWKGVRQPLVEIMRDINASIPNGARGRLNYAELSAAYVVLHD